MSVLQHSSTLQSCLKSVLTYCSNLPLLTFVCILHNNSLPKNIETIFQQLFYCHSALLCGQEQSPSLLCSVLLLFSPHNENRMLSKQDPFSAKRPKTICSSSVHPSLPRCVLPQASFAQMPCPSKLFIFWALQRKLGLGSFSSKRPSSPQPPGKKGANAFFLLQPQKRKIFHFLLFPAATYMAILHYLSCFCKEKLYKYGATNFICPHFFRTKLVKTYKKRAKPT